MVEEKFNTILHSTSLVHTTRTDAFYCKAKNIVVQNIEKNSRAADVLEIYEDTAKEMRDFIENNSSKEEFDIFDVFYKNVVSPQYTADYKYVDRNEATPPSVKITAEKIAAGLLTTRDVIDEDITIPALMVQLHHCVPRGEDGLPMPIKFDKDITDPELYLTAAAKNTSNGSLLSTTKTAATKQQTHMENCAMTQYVATLLSTPNTMVPIFPNDTSIKNENLPKKGKGRRFFMMESPTVNQLMQVFYGQIADSQHQIPLSTFFNGLASERGIGRYTLSRQLLGQGILIEKLESLIAQLLEDGYTIEQISESLNRVLLCGTNDFTSFEYFHNIHAAMNDHIGTSFYYVPTIECSEAYYKGLGYLAESVFILEFHIGDGEVDRGAAAIMASGQFRTLLGNTGRGKSYTTIGYFIMSKKNKLPKKTNEIELFNNYTMNMSRQGDDSHGVFLTKIFKYVIELFRTIHNDMRVKLKPEILNLISNHNFTSSNIMTNDGSNFLKYCIIFDPETMKFQYSRNYQSFLLRMLNSNTVEIAPTKMLQVARSHALSAGGCPMAYLHAEVLYEKSLAYLKKNNLLKHSIVDRDLFLEGMSTELEMYGDSELDDNTIAKNKMKHMPDISEEETPTGVVSFPTMAEVSKTVDVDEHLIYRLQQNDVNYAYYRLTYPMSLEFFLKSQKQ